MLGLAQSYLDPLLAAGVDTVVLGCTHYPLLTGVLSLVLGEDVTLVSSAEETAKDVYRVLTRADLLRDPRTPAAASTSSSPPATPSPSPGSAAASWAPRSGRCCARTSVGAA